MRQAVNSKDDVATLRAERTDPEAFAVFYRRWARVLRISLGTRSVCAV
jgi:hypothetical protein